MMELIHIAPSGDYARYEKLVMLKDRIVKEAGEYHLAYIREFGEALTEVFSLQIDCIALRKEIALYVKARNLGKNPDAEEISQSVQSQMSAYHDELNRMLREKEFADSGKNVSYEDVRQIKFVYRRLAKLLHPDISPLTRQYPQLDDLFQRVILAYKFNNLKELQTLEVLINGVLSENHIEGFDMVISDIAERIAETEKEIDTIIHTTPYTNKDLLENDELCEQKKAEIESQRIEYEDYKSKLGRELATMKEGVR